MVKARENQVPQVETLQHRPAYASFWLSSILLHSLPSLSSDETCKDSFQKMNAFGQIPANTAVLLLNRRVFNIVLNYK